MQNVKDERYIKQMLGLSEKAGKLSDGEFSVEEAVRAKKACLVLLAADASANTAKKFSDKTTYYHIPCLQLAMDKEALGACVGRASRAVLCVNDAGLAAAILKKA